MQKPKKNPIILIFEEDADDRLYLKEVFKEIPTPISAIFFSDIDNLIKFLYQLQPKDGVIVLLNMFSSKDKLGGHIRKFCSLFPSIPITAMISLDFEKDYFSHIDQNIEEYIKLPISSQDLENLLYKHQDFLL